MIQMFGAVIVFAVYFYLDNKYTYTGRICSYLKINTQKRAFPLLLLMLFLLMAITIVNIFVNISPIIYCLISGLLAGFGIGVLTNMPNR